MRKDKEIRRDVRLIEPFENFIDVIYDKDSDGMLHLEIDQSEIKYSPYYIEEYTAFRTDPNLEETIVPLPKEHTDFQSWVCQRYKFKIEKILRELLPNYKVPELIFAEVCWLLNEDKTWKHDIAFDQILEEHDSIKLKRVWPKDYIITCTIQEIEIKE